MLLTIGQLCTSTLNVKTFLEKGLVDQLINLVLLGGDDNVKKEAVVCLSKVSMFDCHSCRRILCCDIFLRFLAIIPLSLCLHKQDCHARSYVKRARIKMAEQRST